MDVGIVGGGPAAEAVRAALDDVDVTTLTVPAERAGEFDAAVVVDAVDGDSWTTVDRAADRWVAVTVGGIAGHPIDGVDASVALFTADSGCHRCLGRRVAAADPPADADATGVRSAVRYAGAVAGRRLVRHLSGEELGGTVVEVPGLERSFLPVPNCRCDPGRDRTLALDDRTVDLDDAVGRMERAVDDRVGVVAEVGERESFPAPYYMAATTDTTGFSDAAAPPYAAGCDDDWNRAYAKAVGEALERYAGGVYRIDEFRTAAAAALDGAVAPGRFVAPEWTETPAPDEQIAWAPALGLAESEPRWLPAAAVHYPQPTERVVQGITTGLGLGNSTVEATLSGLYEVVERDAAMLSWYSTYDPLGVDVDRAEFDRLRKRAGAESLSVTPLALTQDVDVPVIACAVHREGEWPRFAVGSGAALDAGAAATGALAEALQNWMELRAMGPDEAASDGGAIAEYAAFPEHAREFVTPEVTVPASSLGPDDPPTGAAELEGLVDRIADAGLDAYAARITTRDLAALEFEAVRAVVPTAQPLFQGEPFFGDRLGRVARSMGYEPTPDGPYHPFP